jgi:hypothetical protein
MERERTRGTATMRIDGPGVTHDYISCGDCGAGLSAYAMERKLDCASHQTMRRIIARNEGVAHPGDWPADPARFFHYQPDNGTFGSLFLRSDAPLGILDREPLDAA